MFKDGWSAVYASCPFILEGSVWFHEPALSFPTRGGEFVNALKLAISVAVIIGVLFTGGPAEAGLKIAILLGTAEAVCSEEGVRGFSGDVGERGEGE